MRKLYNIESTKIEKAENQATLDLIENLAAEIWMEHYTPIIGKDQVLYMLDKYQSVDAMKGQMEKGFEYYLLRHGEIPGGYLGLEKRGDTLFLSKIYLLRYFRGRGLGRLMMEFAQQRATELGCLKMQLTVNKKNSEAIRAYERMGFVNLKPLVLDIGGGFVMDDFLMEKSMVKS